MGITATRFRTSTLRSTAVPHPERQPDTGATALESSMLRLNRFTFVTARASLCLRSSDSLPLQTQDSIPGEAAVPLVGAGISPAGNTRFVLAHHSAGTHSPVAAKPRNPAAFPPSFQPFSISMILTTSGASGFKD